MFRRVFTSAALVAALISSAASAANVKYGAVLAPEAVGARGTGWSSLEFDLTNKTMLVRAGFTGLSGNTTAAHVHGPTAEPGTGNAGVITETPSFSGFPTGVTSGTYEHLYDMTLPGSFNAAFLNNATNGGNVETALASFLGILNEDKAYLNIHTSTFGGGEIRGFFKIVPPVPEPASLASAAGAVLILRRRR